MDPTPRQILAESEAPPAPPIKPLEKKKTYLSRGEPPSLRGGKLNIRGRGARQVPAEVNNGMVEA